MGLFGIAEIMRNLEATHGRAVMQKLPRLMEAQQPQIMALIEQQLMPILPQIQGILAAP